MTVTNAVRTRLPCSASVVERCNACDELAQTQFYVCVTAVFLNGIVGDRILDYFSDGFYYKPDRPMLNMWLSVNGALLSLYGVGCVFFLMVLLRSTQYKRERKAG